MLAGDIGIGKTHLLNDIAKEGDLVLRSSKSEGGYLYLSSPSPMKQFLQKLCEKYCPDWTERLPNKARSSAKEIVELINNVVKDKKQVSPTKEVLVIDNLHKLRGSDIEVFLILLESFTVLAAADDTPTRLKQIWWKFRRIDLAPLGTEDSKALVKHYSKGLTIVDYNLLETKILSLAGGLPLAIVDMVNQVKGRSVVRNKDVRDIYHEAGVRFRDWSPSLLVVWAMIIIFRFVALGSHSFEGYILAGFGMAAIMTAIRFLRRMR
jgi:hypothetical protein